MKITAICLLIFSHLFEGFYLFLLWHLQNSIALAEGETISLHVATGVAELPAAACSGHPGNAKR